MLIELEAAKKILVPFQLHPCYFECHLCFCFFAISPHAQGGLAFHRQILGGTGAVSIIHLGFPHPMVARPLLNLSRLSTNSKRGFSLIYSHMF